MARGPLVKFDFDPFEIAGVSRRKFSDSDISEIMSDVSDLVKEKVLDYVGSGESPVSGRGAFKKLNPEYAKDQKGGNRTANLELEGDLLDSVKVIQAGNKLRLTVDEDQQPKADGHNNFSGESKLPVRRFIPYAKQDETFKSDIIKTIRDIVLEKLPNGE